MIVTLPPLAVITASPLSSPVKLELVKETLLLATFKCEAPVEVVLVAVTSPS
ncbi:hypothetical protein [Psittacicella melopsittaci]|uniref:hypothetical protein n=1 Tax=Psittacicella melopsittaci TaxID=2028576 RepID=UPI001CA6DD91|nr:hypothetical protein [Psittacicella melopsittaci]